MLNQRGQGFDVFKLLIAAVVAGAILVILMQTLQIIRPLNTQDPNEVAATSVKSGINNPGIPDYVENVTFKKGSALRAATIAEKSKALSTNQVCVKKSGSTPNPGSFEDNGGVAVIEYIGNSDQQVRLVVLCDRAGGLLAKNGYIDVLGDYKTLTGTDGLGVDSAGCFEGVPDSSRACLIAIVSEQ